MQLPFMVIAREQKFMSAHFRVHPFLVNSMIFFPLYIFNSYILRCSGYVLAVVMYGQEKQLNFCRGFKVNSKTALTRFEKARDLKVGPLDCARSALHTEPNFIFGPL